MPVRTGRIACPPLLKSVLVFPLLGPEPQNDFCVIRSRRSFGKSQWNCVLRFAANCLYCELPAIVSEGLVGLSHLVNVFALLDRVAAIVRRVEDLTGELVLHGLLTA